MVITVRAHCNPLDIYKYIYNTIHMYSGITSGRVLNGELLYTKILEVNLFAFAYRLFRRDFSPLDGTSIEWGEISTKQSVGKCKQINFKYIYIYIQRITMYPHGYHHSGFIYIYIYIVLVSMEYAFGRVLNPLGACRI